jgi:transcriptional regulator with XRE-family HTH domain
MQPPSSVAQRFGRAVRDLRQERKMTQQELADACGLDIGYIGQIERGQRNPTLGVMHSVAAVLRVKISDLLKSAKL